MSHLHRTRIKICGIRDAESATWALRAGADAVGLVFVNSSPRLIELQTAREIALGLPPFVQAVGLVADIVPGRAERILAEAGVDWVQVHGSESEKDLEKFSLPLIRGFRFSPEAVRRWNACEAVDALLIDGSTGGRGEVFDWGELEAMTDEIDKPVILAGGLTPDNVGEAIARIRPWAVDVSSGVERERGIKDENLIYDFCAAVRKADAQLFRG